MNRLRCVVLSLVFVWVADVSGATTWSDRTMTCPLCETEGVYKVIASYGTYIYDWPSRFQFLFWPLTDRNSIYTCLHCRFTCYMWDFDDVPAEHHEAIRKALKETTLDGEYEAYPDIPMSVRLGIAGKVYEVLGRDSEFWCQYQRLLGFHLARESANAEDEETRKELAKRAVSARKAALEMVENMLEDEENEGQKKRLLLIAGAMNHFLGDDELALARFEQALQSKYAPADVPESRRAGKDLYLSNLLEEYVRRINEGDRPADEGSAKK